MSKDIPLLRQHLLSFRTFIDNVRDVIRMITSMANLGRSKEREVVRLVLCTVEDIFEESLTRFRRFAIEAENPENGTYVTSIKSSRVTNHEEIIRSDSTFDNAFMNHCADTNNEAGVWAPSNKNEMFSAPLNPSISCALPGHAHESRPVLKASVKSKRG